MSKICLCAIRCTDKYNQSEVQDIVKNILLKYNRGDCGVDWNEPILSTVQDHYICSITDGPNNTDCEMLLLPDGCFYNSKTNSLEFAKRIVLLQDIATTIINRNLSIMFFIGDSGELAEDYQTVTTPHRDLCNYLESTLNTIDTNSNLHIIVT